MDMKFEHLVLLIGTNPLPNYVVAKYFLQMKSDLKSIIAIHTEETKNACERLKKVMEKCIERELCFQCCPIDRPYDIELIRQSLQKHTKLRSKDTFHLNYTGGKKIMAVRTYRTLNKYFMMENHSNGTFSYLDANDFIIKSDTESPSEDLREKIHIPFKHLLALHGCKIDKQTRPFRIPEINRVFGEYIQQGVINRFVIWKYEMQELHRSRQKKINSDQNTEDPPFPEYHLKDFESHRYWPLVKDLLVKHLPEEQRWRFDENGRLLNLDDENERKEFSRVSHYLDGKWFECYALEDINTTKTEADCQFRIISNFEIKKRGLEKPFEMDILILFGFQLCGISITTKTDEDACKGKACEIMHRTRQIGGDESRVILLTILSRNETRELEIDLATDTGKETNLRVFGLEEFRNRQLWTNIKKHILSQ